MDKSLRNKFRGCMEKHNFMVDVDNIEFKPAIDPISSHSRIADYYKCRPPYMRDFFHESSIKLGLTKESKLLDLCCGRGEVSSGFSQFVRGINAIDGSAEMLKNSINRDNVKYRLADVNSNEFIFDEDVDHVLIGSAIHWISGEKIEQIAKNNLNSGGKFFVCHTLFKSDDRPYGKKLNELNKKYGRSSLLVDLWGKDKFAKCEFIQVDQMRLYREVSFDVEFLYWNQLSYAYGDFYKNIFENLASYKTEFIRAISPHAINGKISAGLVNWAVIYQSQSPC